MNFYIYPERSAPRPHSERIVTSPARVISDGFCQSMDAFMSVHVDVPGRFVRDLLSYIEKGLITLHTAKVEPNQGRSTT